MLSKICHSIEILGRSSAGTRSAPSAKTSASAEHYKGRFSARLMKTQKKQNYANGIDFLKYYKNNWTHYILSRFCRTLHLGWPFNAEFLCTDNKISFLLLPTLIYFSNNTPDFSTFKPASESKISKILFNCPNKQSDSDPIPTWLLKECSALLVPTITNIVNLSLSSRNFHRTLKESVISPLLKNLP